MCGGVPPLSRRGGVPPLPRRGGVPPLPRRGIARQVSLGVDKGR